MKQEENKAVELIKDTILFLTDCEYLKDSIEYFEKIKHKQWLPRNKELFEEISASQLGVLFKLLVDLEEVDFEDNILRFKEEK